MGQRNGVGVVHDQVTTWHEEHNRNALPENVIVSPHPSRGMQGRCARMSLPPGRSRAATEARYENVAVRFAAASSALPSPPISIPRRSKPAPRPAPALEHKDLHPALAMTVQPSVPRVDEAACHGLMRTVRGPDPRICFGRHPCGFARRRAEDPWERNESIGPG